VKFEVLTIPRFNRDLKKLVKRYPSLKAEFIQLANSLATEPSQGTSLGNTVSAFIIGQLYCPIMTARTALTTSNHKKSVGLFCAKNWYNNCFKIRLAIGSKGKGKSGGARVITCLQVREKEVYLLTIFDKSEKESIPDSELKQLLAMIP